MSRTRPSRGAAHMSWARVLVGGVGVLVAYYAVPVKLTEGELLRPVGLTVIGVALLAWAMIGQLRRHFYTDAEVRLPLLIILAMLVVAVFAFGYYALEVIRPGEMGDLETRTDSLYFTLQVLTTVGLGDVHAAGQTARAMVSAQMAFDLVFVAAGGSLLASVIRTRITQARESHTHTDPTAAPAADPSAEPTEEQA
ncbi:two pore domain potassium channel family protein [Nocardioides sp. BGMRC 2183]|nr:two pore domain potassium channel family protein [Nocardioides sp. BGMRC 2183]